jgi:hypothetical protein
MVWTDEDTRIYVSELQFLQRQINHLQKLNKTNPEPSIDKTIENLRNSQDKLYGALAYHGITFEGVYKVVMENSDQALIKELLDLQRDKNRLQKQLANPKLPLEKWQRLQSCISFKLDQYAAKWHEIADSPNKDELMKKAEQAITKGSAKDRTRSRTHDRDRSR